MTDEEYISRYAIGQVIKYTNQYWQIIKFEPPQTSDVFIPNSNEVCVCTCPPWMRFDINDKRYIVTEVTVTPVKEDKVKESLAKKKLNKGTVIVHENVFYEVTDYRTPRCDEFYAHVFSDSQISVFQRLYPNLPGSTDSFNIVKKIEPYTKGQVIKFNGKSYVVVDYTFPKENQVIVSPHDTTVYINHWVWHKEKTFILESIASISGQCCSN